MTREFDELRRRYERWSTDDLLRVVYEAEEYRPEAVEIARGILAAREVPIQGPTAEAVVAELQRERAMRDDAARVPLSIGLRVVCFLFCGIIGIAIALIQMSQGHTRRAKDAWRWVGFGWLARVLVLLSFYV